MASATVSALAGSLLSPLLNISLEKLITYLWDYLSSSPSSSSPDEAEKQQQLKDSLNELKEAKLDVELMQSRINRVFKKDMQNKRLVGLHNKLKDVGYDIQDLESDMKYMQLEREVQEINKADQEADTTTTQSSGKRSFPFRLPTVFSSKKKRRLPASSQSLSLSTDEDIVRQVTSIIKQIKDIESRLKNEITLEESFDRLNLNRKVWQQRPFAQNGRVTTSSTNERKIYGRKDEIQQLIEFLKGPTANDSNVSIAPIVGMGGMGKTTLAQFAFNDTEIENNFDVKGWIFVSDHFDRFRIMREMVDIVCPTSERCDTTNFDFLERQLKRHLIGKKFLLVLDDVWSDEWQQLLDLLQSTQAHATKIIVTCRDATVFKRMDQSNKIILGGIDDEEYWLLFMDCASAQNNPDLHDIGRRIVEKLMGSPLAAKTVGKLLGRNLTEEHWNEVLENDLWKFKTDAHDIMPALALSYYHLPPHLQPCFAFCSVLPKRYPIYWIDDLVSMWIANGYVSEIGSSSKTMHEIGEEYFRELLAMCFFDSYGGRTIKIHDLMRDLAQLVSHGETCIYESRKDKKISEYVHHLCAEDLTDLGLICKTNNLRTLLLLYGAIDMSAFNSHEGAFNKIRVLVIHDEDMEEFPNAIPHLKHLQHLDLCKTKIKSIPESLCGLYQLRVLKLPSLWTLPSQFYNLINLEIFLYNDIYQEQYFSVSRDIIKYHVNRKMGFTVAQLRNMNKLRGPLFLDALESISNREEAMKAKLKEKFHIKKLYLHWRLDTMDGHELAVQEEVLEGLEPHPNLEELLIGGYMGSKPASWLMKLQNLNKLCLINSRNLACLPSAIGLFPSLTRLELTDVKIESFASNVMPTLHALEELYLICCDELLSVEGLQVLPSLKKLWINNCPKFRSWCTEELTKLERLSIHHCQNLESLPDWLHHLHLIQWLTIKRCSKFNSLPNGGLPSSLQTLAIMSCDPGLMERCQQVGSSEWQMIQHISQRCIEPYLKGGKIKQSFQSHLRTGICYLKWSHIWPDSP